jgi:hypothetical protein
MTIDLGRRRFMVSSFAVTTSPRNACHPILGDSSNGVKSSAILRMGYRK